MANVSIDVACMNMDLPDAALFSMDDPARSTDKVAPGGVMEVTMDDNMLAAEQQTHAEDMEQISDWDSLRQTIVDDIGVEKMDKATDVVQNDVGNEGMIDAALQNPAVKKASDNTTVLQDASKADVQGPSKGNVVPFKRQSAPRL